MSIPYKTHGNSFPYANPESPYTSSHLDPFGIQFDLELELVELALAWLTDSLPTVTNGKVDTTIVAVQGSSTITYAKAAGPSWISVDASTGQVTGTAPLSTSSANYTVSFTASTETSSNTKEFTFTVEATALSGYFVEEFWGNYYEGYATGNMAVSQFYFFDNPPNGVTVKTPYVQTQTLTISQSPGYDYRNFRMTSKWTAPVSGNYTFRTNSDDASFLFVTGDQAFSYYDPSVAFSGTIPSSQPGISRRIVNNGGTHGEQDRYGYLYYITAGDTFDVTLFFGEASGGHYFKFDYQHPGSSTWRESVADQTGHITAKFNSDGTTRTTRTSPL